jgi:hypothetical protein
MQERLVRRRRTLPPTFFLRASSWSMMPAEVVSTMTPNCAAPRALSARRDSLPPSQTALWLFPAASAPVSLDTGGTSAR